MCDGDGNGDGDGDGDGEGDREGDGDGDGEGDGDGDGDGEGDREGDGEGDGDGDGDGTPCVLCVCVYLMCLRMSLESAFIPSKSVFNEERDEISDESFNDPIIRERPNRENMGHPHTSDALTQHLATHKCRVNQCVVVNQFLAW